MTEVSSIVFVVQVSSSELELEEESQSDSPRWSESSDFWISSTDVTIVRSSFGRSFGKDTCMC